MWDLLYQKYIFYIYNFDQRWLSDKEINVNQNFSVWMWTVSHQFCFSSHCSHQSEFADCISGNYQCAADEVIFLLNVLQLSTLDSSKNKTLSGIVDNINAIKSMNNQVCGSFV